MQHWHDKVPIYQQLADKLAADLLDGQPEEGEAMPSVRTLASAHLINPLTVSRALQRLSERGLLENRRGQGLYVRAGARRWLLAQERQQFLMEEWPQLRARLERLGLTPSDLEWENE